MFLFVCSLLKGELVHKGSRILVFIVDFLEKVFLLNWLLLKSTIFFNKSQFLLNTFSSVLGPLSRILLFL